MLLRTWEPFSCLMHPETNCFALIPKYLATFQTSQFFLWAWDLYCVNRHIFLETYVQTMLAENPYICCLISSGKHCLPEFHWYESCNNLLPNITVKTTFYCVSIITLGLSVISVFFHSFSKKSRKGKHVLRTTEHKIGSYELMVLSVNFADMILSSSLFLLWIADAYHRKEFFIKQAIWKASFLCYFNIGLVIQFNVISPFLLSFYAWSRFMVVSSPLDTLFKQSQFTLQCLLLQWALSICLSVGFVFLFYFSDDSITVALCSPFIDPTDSSLLVKVNAWIIVVLQFSATVFMISIYIALTVSLHKFQSSFYEVKTNRPNHNALLIQIIIVTGSNVLCWIPSGIIFVVSLFEKQYSTDLLIWTIIAISPVNSVINPTIFIVNKRRKTKEEKWETTQSLWMSQCPKWWNRTAQLSSIWLCVYITPRCLDLTRC